MLSRLSNNYYPVKHLFEDHNRCRKISSKQLEPLTYGFTSHWLNLAGKYGSEFNIESPLYWAGLVFL